MKSVPVLLSSFVECMLREGKASLTSSSRSLPGFFILLFFAFPAVAQTDSVQVTSSTDSAYIVLQAHKKKDAHFPAKIIGQNDLPLTAKQKTTRTWLVGGANVLGYGGTMIALYSAWYKDYPQSGFHTFNDWPEWKQVDKAGHFYSAYIESYGSMEMWRWAGLDRKKRIWIGGMSGAVYQTVIETLDGFSAGWGWSWGDFGANILGSSTLVSQELAWNEQRIKIKFSFHKKNYTDPALDQRSDVLFGKSGAERLLKDYNGQTYWASITPSMFAKNSRFPRWLSVAIGYGAEGMFGGRENTAKDANGNLVFNRPDIRRYRQWYLAPDIDLSRIRTNKKVVRIILGALNAFKFPAPALELSEGKLKMHAISF